MVKALIKKMTSNAVQHAKAYCLVYVAHLFFPARHVVTNHGSRALAKPLSPQLLLSWSLSLLSPLLFMAALLAATAPMTLALAQQVTAESSQSPKTPAAQSAKPAQPSTSSELSSYKLGVGDVISAQVVGEDELKREKVRLSDAGTLSFPYLGEIRVRGMTVGELEDYITKGLKGRYLLNPQVTVTILEYRDFFVNGLVGKPGGYPFTPGLTVRKAISIAGGFKERASKEKINVIREDDNKGNSQRISLDAPVRPGDIITVEESFF